MMSAVILVIDDDPKVKKSFELAFPEYEFLGALNGDEGLKLLQRANEIELVFLDVRMNGQDGIDLLERIKLIDPRVGIMMLTGFGSKEIVVQALRRHADDFIDKPYRVDEMKDKIEKFFEANRRYESPDGHDKSSMNRIVRLLEKNYLKDFTLRDAASVASLSPKYLSRKFKQEIRKNFTQYKLNLRIAQAKKLLENSFLNIDQIADKVGYENSESFMKIFKKMTECTPTEYRTRELAPHGKRLKEKKTGSSQSK